MAAITHSQILTRQGVINRGDFGGAVCIVAKPDAIDDGTLGVFKVREHRGPGGTTAATVRGRRLDDWKNYSYAALGTAYGL